jgi:hypothetical protein
MHRKGGLCLRESAWILQPQVVSHLAQRNNLAIPCHDIYSGSCDAADGPE